MTDDNEERLVQAIEMISACLMDIADTLERIEDRLSGGRAERGQGRRFVSNETS